MPYQNEDQKDETFAIQNIFGKPPGWLVYWGITCAFVFLMVCLGVAAFVRYPDKLVMKAKLFSINPPIEVVAKISAEIDTIYEMDKSTVTKGSPLLKFRSTVDEKDIQSLFLFFDKFAQIKNIPEYLAIPFPKALKLGSLSPSYGNLMQQYEEFQHFLSQSITFVKIRSIQNEINQINQLNKSLNKQEGFYNEEISLTQKDYTRHITLRAQGVIADLEKEKAETRVLVEQRSLEAFKAQQLNNNVRIDQLQTQVNDLTAERASSVSTRIFELNQLIQKIKSEINDWEESHWIVAPFDAQIVYAKYLVNNLYMKVGDVVMTLVPSNTGKKFIAVGDLPIRAAGTLAVGQEAILELENYPPTQYGYIKASVADFSIIPTAENYTVELSLPSPFITSYKKEIPQLQNMTANVTINTKSYSLLERLFQDLLKAIDSL